MAQYAVPQQGPERPTVAAATHIASPAPLGLGVTAILTAIVGCFYTGFIIPFDTAGMRAGVGAVLLVGGIILVLAGMWEFAKGYLLTASTFTAYGGFLSMLGLIFFPTPGILASIGGNFHLFIGLVFLCWTIFLGILCFGASRTNASLAATLLVLFVAYLFLMLGSLAGDNSVLLKIGGWFAIAAALVAWLASLASILSTSTAANEVYRIPFGRRLAVVE